MDHHGGEPARGGEPAWPGPRGPVPGTAGYAVPGGYGGYGGYGYPPSRRTEPSAVTALVLSLLPFPVVAAVAALLVAAGARQRIQASAGTVTGLRMATAARVLAWLQLVVAAVVLAAVTARLASAASATAVVGAR